MKLEVAANYEKLANAGSVLGMYEDAIAAENMAIERYESLSAEENAESGRMLASALNNRGNLLKAAGRYAEADESYTAAVELYRKANDAEPFVLAEMLCNAGANSVSLGDDERAKDFFSESLLLLSGMERNADVLSATAKTDYNYGVLFYRGGSYYDAEKKLTDACELYEKLLDITDSLQNRAAYIHSASALAACRADLGEYDGAEEVFAGAMEIAEELAADGENTDYQRLYAQLLNNHAVNFNIQGKYTEADGLYAGAAEIYGALSDKTDTATDWSMYAVALLNRGENAFKAKDYPLARDCFEEGLFCYRSALDGLGDYDTAMYYAWLCYYEVLYPRDFEAAIDAGLTAYELQPGNVFVNLNLGYACLYAGYYEDAEELLTWIAGLGEGQAETIRMDLAAQRAAGLSSEHMDAILAKIGE